MEVPEASPMETTRLDRDEASRARLDVFLSRADLVEALVCWLDLRPGEAVPNVVAIVSRLLQDVAALDEKIETQLNAILHHAEFQRMEAGWRGLRWLVDRVPEDAAVKVKFFSASWVELARDADRAIEFDQSQLFKKVYSAEFGSPGGEPYGLLLGDYYVGHKIRPDQPVDDMRALGSISLVAAAAFAPFVVSAHPTLLGFDSFREIELPVDLPRTFRGVEYTGWRALRETEDSRYVAITLPRILMRAPYAHDLERRDGFPFTERCREHEDYLWGNACFALGSVAIRAFAEWGWLADIRGTKRGKETGGLVLDLPRADHGTDAPGVAVRFATETIITDRRERVLGDLGFVSLCALPSGEGAVFYSTPSLHDPPRFSTTDATVNAKLGALLQYILCASRVAHFIKVMCRDMTGSLISIHQIERRLRDWLVGMTASSDNASDEMQARFPLRDSNVTVRELPGKPGCYSSVFHLRPHFQLDQMTSSMRLVTELVTER